MYARKRIKHNQLKYSNKIGDKDKKILEEVLKNMDAIKIDPKLQTSKEPLVSQIWSKIMKIKKTITVQFNDELYEAEYSGSGDLYIITPKIQ